MTISGCRTRRAGALAESQPGTDAIFAVFFLAAGRQGHVIMTKDDLADTYRAYIACLNAQDWSRLGQFVHDEASHNGERFGLAGYRAMLERDFAEIPDLHFDIQLLVCE